MKTERESQHGILFFQTREKNMSYNRGSGVAPLEHALRTTCIERVDSPSIFFLQEKFA